MTEHYRQNKSNFRTGEPADHLKAKDYIATLLKWSGYDSHMEYPLVDPLTNSPYKHNYDVIGFKEMIVIEIDDPNLHAKPRKIRNDLIAMNHVEKYFPISAEFIRLNKDEINNTETMQDYLSKAFWPHIH